MASRSNPLPCPHPGAHVSRSVHSTSALVRPTPDRVGGAFYNENDPFAAAWLRELIVDGLIAPGVVDERDIRDVTPAELARFTQCHFFAGIGVWSLALRQAGWPDERPIWTGSCPCQPFSTAGKGGGFADERHLWPAFHWLIEQCAPKLVIGEQVASKDGLAWLDLVSADVEASGYTFGAADTCAAGFGAPHIRQRLYWMADSANGYGRSRECATEAGVGTDAERWRRPSSGSRPRGLADADEHGHEGRSFEAVPGAGRRKEGNAAGRGSVRLAGGVADDDRPGREIVGPTRLHGQGQPGDDPARRGEDVRLADSELQPGRAQHGCQQGSGTEASADDTAVARCNGEERGSGPLNGLWRDADWLSCTDGKWRPVAPGTFPLAPAGTIRNRVGTLRGAGNAINLAQATGFIEAVIDVLEAGSGV